MWLKLGIMKCLTLTRREKLIEIKKLTIEDVDKHFDSLCKLIDICMDSAFGSVESDYAKSKVSVMKEYINDGSAHIYFAEVNGDMLGFVWAYPVAKPNGKNLHIAYISVLPEHQRKGIAAKLIKVIENDAKEGKFDTVELFVDFDNFAAKQLYDSLDFKAERLYMIKDI